MSNRNSKMDIECHYIVFATELTTNKLSLSKRNTLVMFWILSRGLRNSWRPRNLETNWVGMLQYKNKFHQTGSVIILLLNFCFKLLPLFVGVQWLVLICYLILSVLCVRLGLQSASFLASTLILMSCVRQCSVALPHCVVGWAVPCVIVVIPDYTYLFLIDFISLAFTSY